MCEHLEAGRLTAGHARAIAAAPEPERLARAIVQDGLTVRQAEALARKAQEEAADCKPAPRPRRARSKDADTQALEQDLTEALGVAVQIVDRGGQGELRLRYTSLEQLDGLCQKLSGG